MSAVSFTALHFVTEMTFNFVHVKQDGLDFYQCHELKRHKCFQSQNDRS